MTEVTERTFKRYCISLTQGMFAAVDEADYAWLSQWKWHYSACGYAERRMTYTKGKTRLVKMHRLILGIDGVVGDVQGDHINGDKLDNRRANLRVCSNRENSWNYRARRNSTGYKGVTLVRRPGNWTGYRASIQGDYLGYFRSAEEAAVAYDEAARKRYGEFAAPNFSEVSNGN